MTRENKRERENISVFGLAIEHHMQRILNSRLRLLKVPENGKSKQRAISLGAEDPAYELEEDIHVFISLTPRVFHMGSVYWILNAYYEIKKNVKSLIILTPVAR